MASVWDVASERRVWETIVTHTSDRSGERFAVAYSPDAKRIAVRGPLDAVLLDGATGKSSAPSTLRGAMAYLVFAFTPDGQSLAVGGDGVCLESLATGAIERKVPTAAEATGQAVLAIRILERCDLDLVAVQAPNAGT